MIGASGGSGSAGSSGSFKDEFLGIELPPKCTSPSQPHQKQHEMGLWYQLKGHHKEDASLSYVVSHVEGIPGKFGSLSEKDIVLMIHMFLPRHRSQMPRHIVDL